MLQTLYLTKVIENNYWIGKKKKLKSKPTTKMSEEDFERLNAIVQTIKK